MTRRISILLIALVSIIGCKEKIKAQGQTTENPFLWGIASAAYQVEGAYQVDGKGESKWDFLTNKVGVTQFLIGQKQTGNVTINMYDRTQYLKDIELMKKLGVNSYRFSLDWSRIIPDGTGAVNEKGLAHYDLLIDDLKAAGIEPVVTLYHFDYPFVLVQKGGWGNPEMIHWYKNYAKIALERYGKKVKHFITFNEPYIEFFVAEYLMNMEQSKEPAVTRFARGMMKAHRQMVASAEVIKMYHEMNLSGKIGMTFNFSPCSPLDPNNPKDVVASALQEKLLNTVFLDGYFKGTYPKEVVDIFTKYDPAFLPTPADMKILAANKPDFLGINFYAPALVKHDAAEPFETKWMDVNTDKNKSHNGPVRPEELYKFLLKIKKEYNNPEIMITENGAGFEGEDIKASPVVKDPLRADYIKRHIEAVAKAKKDGVRMIGYFPWSGWDNFEWVFGYTKRFGLIYVDFETQERIPKQSYFEYQRIIKKYKKL
ncbi:family 1 glycosylhydrolase [Flavobacterium sp.]|uniref:glycoside hydrolase family 1 protein n=1 Tax=Flavobacterium sp. TaxID=239 RepID=UPI001B522A3A|nr:family 1 glycosylhydrolase [Flavobacterium sp.]MBP6181074.1 family 1 glycosylhydrolase [Flavobacterium sp.]